ncbi:MAG: hypothetical protein KKD18_02710 [Nanoarchaeota archaeon]|nr:hypothetical protein [Nanoarchaeota archaeon]
MELKQTVIQKTFTVMHDEKCYCVDYINSDGQILGLINRNNWEISCEDSEELQLYLFKGSTKKEKEEVEANLKLADELIDFCIKNFNNYNTIKVSKRLKAGMKKESKS